MAKEIPSRDGWDVLVVGSGLGALTCAAALSKFGRKVAVLEQHYVAGGCTHMFKRKGYKWDVGVHLIGEMREKDLGYKTMKWLTDGKFAVNHVGKVYDAYYYPDGSSIELPDNSRKFKRLLEERFPEEIPAIRKYFEIIMEASDRARYFFAGKMVPRWTSGWTTPLFEKLGKRWWLKTTQEVVDSLTENKKLKAIWTTNWGYYGSVPKDSSFAVHALTVRHFWNGGYYPKGGSTQFAVPLMETIEAAGGKVFTRNPVEEVLVRNGQAVGVRLKDGNEVFAPKVISGAGAVNTAKSLLPDDFKQSDWAQGMQSLRQSPPCVNLFLGFEGDIRAAGATTYNQWRFDTWDMNHREWDIDDPNSEAPFLFISFPSLKDPEHEQGDNRHTGEVIAFVPWETFDRWKHTRRGFREKEYMQFKKSIADRMLKQTERHIPEVMKHLKFTEVATPLSTKHFIHAPQGAIYGLEPTVERFQSPHLRPDTPIKNFYMTGVDVSILGIAGAMTSGVMTAAKIEKRILPRLF